MTSPSKQKMKGTWTAFKGRLHEAWGTLTNDDLDRFEGRREQLVGYIQQKTGEAREKVRHTLDQIARETKYRF